MAPSKSKKKTGFYFFMKEVQEREARRGHHISMQNLPAFAHPTWKKMSLAEKEVYEERARAYNKDPNMRGGKLASDGTRVEDNLLEEEEKIRLENKMIQDVKRYCNSDCTTIEQFLELTPRKLLYFMSFNLLCVTDEDIYIPIEVGIIEYSIRDGIHRQYTKIIYPGIIPIGYNGAAKDKSEQTHQISVFGEDCSEKDIAVIYDEIKQFISPTGNEEYPPVFCERKELVVTVGCLEWLCRCLRRENIFEVWDATYLLMELTAGVGRPMPSKTVASDLLNKTSFDYHPSTRCPFHEEKDNHFCALSYSKKLCYLISDAVCPLFNIELTERHIPNRAVEEKAYTVTISKETSKRQNLNPVRLDKTTNYYQNVQTKNNVDNETPSTLRQPNTLCMAARQPNTSCIAAEMHNLRLNITTATVPGHGIGRGIRKK